MPRNFREVGAGEMGIIDKSEKGGGVDIEKIKLENEIEAISQEKGRKGLAKGRIKQLSGELKKLESKLQELQSEKQLKNEDTKRKPQPNETKNAAEGKPNWWNERSDMQKEYMAEKKARQIIENKPIEESLNINISQTEELSPKETLSKLKDKEKELMKKIQGLPKTDPYEDLPAEKKDIIAKLEQNREMQRIIPIIAEARQAQAEPKETIKEGEHEADNSEIIKNVKQEELPIKQDKQPKVFQQQHFDDKGEYANNLEARQEMEELAKQPSPEKRQELLKENEEAMKGADEALLTYGEPLIEAQKQLIKNQEKEISEFAKENAQLKENLEKVNNRLAAMEAGIKEEENKLIAEGEVGKTTVEKLKNFVKKHPKVTAAIALGLVGGSYAALGGAPLYFVAKGILAKAGVSIWAPYMGGISSPGYLAAAGGIFGKSIMERIGLIEKEKDVKSAIRDVLANISGNAEVKSDESQIKQEKVEKEENNVISPEDAVKYFEENKDKSNDELKLEDIKKMIEAIKPETTKNLIKFLINKEKRKNNDIFDWLYKKKKEIEKTQKERFDKKATEVKERFDKKATEVRGFIEQLKEGKKTGEEIFEYLENLQYGFFGPDWASGHENFDSKIKPEFDNLSEKEKINMIDLAVEYLKSQEKAGKIVQKSVLRNNLADIIYNEKDFTKNNYIENGKKENVGWLYKKYKKEETKEDIQKLLLSFDNSFANKDDEFKRINSSNPEELDKIFNFLRERTENHVIHEIEEEINEMNGNTEFFLDEREKIGHFNFNAKTTDWDWYIEVIKHLDKEDSAEYNKNMKEAIDKDREWNEFIPDSFNNLHRYFNNMLDKIDEIRIEKAKMTK